MKHFIQAQFETAQKLYDMMLKDHEERINEFIYWKDTTSSLLKKLDERDQIIAELRAEIEKLKK